MNYPCEMIQDLLPLYLDGVCSAESREVIEKHFQECSDCKEFFYAMREADGIEEENLNADRERRKAASLQAVKKKLFRKQILAAVAAVAILAVTVFITVGILKNTVENVVYENNISVSMVDGDLIGRLRGSMETYVNIKRITVTINEQEENYLFFCVSETKWDTLTTNSEVFSEYTLCPADKGAEQIDAVYYFTGNYTDIENMNAEELQEVINDSELLWKK